MEAEYASLYAKAMAARWWVLVVRGVAAILFGVLAIAVPGISLLVLVALWGAFAFLDGIFALVLATRRGRAGRSWGWLLFEGIVGLGAGILAFVWPGATVLALLALAAGWAALTGIAEIAAAIQLRRHIRGEWLLAASGILSIVFGVLLVLFPAAGVLTLVWMIGIYAIVFGLLLISLGQRLHQWWTGERPLPTGGAPTPT